MAVSVSILTHETHLKLSFSRHAFSMVTIVAAAVKSSAWQGTDGIITEGSSTASNNDGIGFKGKNYLLSCQCRTCFLNIRYSTAIFIRGLCEAFARNPSNTDLRILLHSYIDVQVRGFQCREPRVLGLK